MSDNFIPPKSTDYEISLLDLVITLAKHKKIIFGVPLITALFVAILSLLSPDIYTASTQIMPPQQQSGASSPFGQFGALTGFPGFSFGLRNPADIYVAMLKSRTVSDNMIKRFQLQFVFKTKLVTDTRKALENASSIVASKDGFIVVKVDDTNPKLAADMANGYVEELQKLTQVLAVSEASQRRLFFEKQLLQAKRALVDAELSLKKIQEKTGLLQLDAQAQELIRAGAELKGQIAMKEVELGAMRTFATGNNPDYIRTQQLVGGMRNQLAKIETGSVSTSKAPEVGLEYLRKVRDLKYAETIYDILTKQIEIAKIDEAKEGSLIQILDKAVVPDKKSKPKRSLMVLLATVSAGFFTLLYAFIKEALQNARKDTKTQAQLQALKKTLRWN